MSSRKVGGDRLFGALACQTGLVTAEALAAAERFGAEGPIGQTLVALGFLSEHQRAILEELVVEVQRDQEAKAAADSADQATLADTAGPAGESVADQSTDFLSIASVPLGNAQQNFASTLDAPPPTPGSTTGVFGPAGSGRPHAQTRYRLLRLHARGGLGDVFVAHDEDLNREVALKQIRERQAVDPMSRSRFLAEAEITGHLEHPGIVPIYGLGAHDDGRLYYAMRFIRGINLDEAIKAYHQSDPGRDPGGRSVELRKLLRRVIDVCNAISYAHSRGVLHRDLKPENIMLGKFGETLVVDWGLAKMMDSPAEPNAAAETAIRLSSESGTHVTLPGSAMGTPAFMSPEQTSSDERNRLGPRSDVYGLGAILYCVLVGHPPFATGVGTDIEVLLGRVRRGEFAAPRSVHSSISPSLEAICLKAMARDPDNRYAEPRALADDLERWLAGEPVLALPEPFAARLNRWLTRHRAVLTLLLASTLIALAGAAAVVVVQDRSNRSLVRSNRRLEVTNRLALDAIQAYYSGTSEDILLQQPQFEDLRARLLETPLEFYKRLSLILEAGDGGDSRARADIGEACVRVAEINNLIGSREKALAAYRHALPIFERLTRDDPSNKKYAEALGHCQDGQAALEQAIGQTKKALVSYSLALRTWEGLERRHPDDFRFKTFKAACLKGIGKIHGETGKVDESLRSFRAAVDVLEALNVRGPEARESEAELADCLLSLGDALNMFGREGEALQTFQGAVARLRALSARRDDAPELQRAEAVCLLSIAQIQNHRGLDRDSLTSYGEARDTLEHLIERHPAVTQYRRELAACHLGQTRPLRRLERTDLARKSYEDALAIAHRLVKIDPDAVQFSETLAWCYGEYGLFLTDLRLWDEALAKIGEALKIVERQAADDPGVERFQTNRIHGYMNIGNIHLAADHNEAAMRSFETARDILTPLLENRQNDSHFRHMMGVIRNRIGKCFLLRDEFKEARRDFEEAIRNERLALAVEPASELYRRNLSEQYSDLISVCRRLSQASEIAAASLDRLTLWPGDALQCVATAGDLASCIAIAPADADQYGDKAVASLRDAVRAGFRDLHRLSTDPALNPLRSRPEFQALERELMDRAMPGDPFQP